MSFSIYDKQDRLAFTYVAHYNHPTVHFYNQVLENDVTEGLRVPIYLQPELHGKNVIPYPPHGEDVRLFAIAYKQIVYFGELVKHGFYLRETTLPLAEGSIRA
ncbi:MAG TPA: hypothetical protein VIJ14_02900 [Rhabdochlamydiaceae bacterium]